MLFLVDHGPYTSLGSCTAPWSLTTVSSSPANRYYLREGAK
uniref:Uncharacterized protein n=1 Tax=Arundo donax TaxID=35708 RepID=A0A0A8ZM12_ARUDO